MPFNADKEELLRRHILKTSSSSSFSYIFSSPCFSATSSSSNFIISCAIANICPPSSHCPLPSIAQKCRCSRPIIRAPEVPCRLAYRPARTIHNFSPAIYKNGRQSLSRPLNIDTLMPRRRRHVEYTISAIAHFLTLSSPSPPAVSSRLLAAGT